jgi:hypothetical protein
MSADGFERWPDIALLFHNVWRLMHIHRYVGRGLCPVNLGVLLDVLDREVGE